MSRTCPQEPACATALGSISEAAVAAASLATHTRLTAPISRSSYPETSRPPDATVAVREAAALDDGEKSWCGVRRRRRRVATGASGADRREDVRLLASTLGRRHARRSDRARAARTRSTRTRRWPSGSPRSAATRCRTSRRSGRRSSWLGMLPTALEGHDPSCQIVVGWVVVGDREAPGPQQPVRSAGGCACASHGQRVRRPRRRRGRCRAVEP
jgi:hypothetical protein